MSNQPPKNKLGMRIVKPNEVAPAASVKQPLHSRPGGSGLSEEQKRYAVSYQDRSRHMLEKIGRVFIGPKAPLALSAKKMDDITKEIENYIMVKTKKSLNLEEFVLLFGSIAGLQAGLSAAFGKRGLTNEDYHDAGQLFEAGMRAVSKATEIYAKKMRIKPPPPPQSPRKVK